MAHNSIDLKIMENIGIIVNSREQFMSNYYVAVGLPISVCNNID